MWATIMCPKCGERFDVNLNEVEDSVVCRFCFESFELPYHLRDQREIDEDSACLVGTSHQQDTLDSSFWIS